MKISKVVITFLFFVWVIVISLLWRYPIALTASLLLLVIIYFIKYPNRDDLRWFIVAATLGPVGEAVVISSGLWEYHGLTMIGIPIWLPLAWGITAILFKRILID